MRPLIAAAFLLIAAPAYAEEWHCWNPSDGVKAPLIRLREEVPEIFQGARVKNTYFWVVYAAGAKQPAVHTVEGINRRWDFGQLQDDGGFPYALVITPAGVGRYFDFRFAEQTAPSEIFKCAQMKESQ